MKKISANVSEEQVKDISKIKKALEFDSGEKWTLPQVYDKIVEYGIRDMLSGFVCVEDETADYVRSLK